VARLRRAECSAPGIARRRRGRGFEYLQPGGRRVTDRQELTRIQSLAIPPAWRDVWICTDDRGHLQATGLDAAGRKQYLYHERWRAHRDRAKFESMLDFGAALPRLRRRVKRDLGNASSARPALEDITRELVLGCSVRLLDVGFFRVGSEDYARQNNSYGLTTMRREHVTVGRDELVFDFPAKSGQRRVQQISDAAALRVVGALKRRRSGEQLLAYRKDGEWRELQADEVNAYIKANTGEGFTAKDFRTWNASVLAAVALAASGAKGTVGARDRAVRDAIRIVAGYLGNTPAVCRSSYVDPRVIDRYRMGDTIADAVRGLGRNGADLSRPRVRAQVEKAVLALLGDD
jgi:DNA topoisomerase-1